MAVAGVIAVLSTLQLVQAVLIEKEDEDALRVFNAIKMINTTFALIVGLFVLITFWIYSDNLYSQSLWPWLMLLPVSIFFLGQNQILRTWANRKKEYHILLVNTVLLAVLVPLFSISIGLLTNGPIGLFVGLLVGQIVSPIVLLFSLKRKQGISFLGVQNVRLTFDVIKRHRKFPVYSMPAELLSTFSHQLPVFMLSSFSGLGAVGIYNLAIRMLGLPSNLISTSIGEVYRQKAVEEYHESGSMIKVYRSTFRFLSLVGIIVFSIVAIVGPDLFAFVFGMEWRDAGLVARVLSLIFLLRFINSPLSYAIYIKNKQHIDLIAGLWFVLSSTVVMFLGFNYGLNYIQVVGLYGINFSLLYIILIIYTYRLSK